MPKYCLDTSGLSKPFIDLPQHVFPTLWQKVGECIANDCFCWNDDIAEQFERLVEPLQSLLKNRERTCRFRDNDVSWPYDKYIALVSEWQTAYKQYISEFNDNRKDTIGLTDLSIVALAKTLTLPVVSMERPNSNQPSEKKIRIPELCEREKIKHLTFVEFLEAENIVV